MNPTWAHGVLRNAEECWALYMKGFGMNEPCGKDKQGRKYLINFTCTESGYCAGGDRMNIDISGRKPGEKLLYTGPHLCVTCADENRVMNIYLKVGETAPDCENCGSRAVWEP